MLFFLIFFYFYTCSLIQATEQIFEKLTTQIGRHLYRSLTQRGELHEIVKHDHRFLFSNWHWIKGLSSKTLTTRTASAFLLNPEGETAQLHKKLGRKLIESYEQNKILGVRKNMLQRPEKRPIGVCMVKPSAVLYEQDIQPNFLDGHCLSIKLKTHSPKVLVNLYQEQDDSHAKPIIAKWFIPIEQVFFSKNLGMYKRNLAILSRWSAHSRFVLMVIPEETEVSLHIGIAAPQYLIENEKIRHVVQSQEINKFQGEILKIMAQGKEYLGKFAPPLSPDEEKLCLLKFCEFFPGGATQLFVEYVKDYYLFDIDVLYNQDGSIFSPNFSTERMHDETWATPSNPRRSHFLCDHDNIQICIHQGLANLFSNGEFDAEKEDLGLILKRLAI